MSERHELQRVEQKGMVPATPGLGMETESAIARSEIKEKSKFAIAKQFRRDETRATKKLLEAAKIPDFAAKCYYSYPRGKSEVFGGSINLALEMARVFGNIDIERIIVDPDKELDKRTIRVSVTDLETNMHSSAEATFKKLIQRVQADGRTAWVQPDERDLRELTNRHFAILTRNCIFDIVPRWLTKRIVDVARDSVKKQTRRMDINELREAVLRQLEDMAVYKQQVEDYIGHSYETTSAEELVELRGIIQSIRDGATKPEDYFRKRQETTEPLPEHKPVSIQDILNGTSIRVVDEPLPIKNILAGPSTRVAEEPAPEEPETEEVLEADEQEEEQHEGKEGEPEPYGDDRLIKEYKAKLSGFTSAKEVQAFMRELRTNRQAMRLSDHVFSQVAAAANDRLRALTRK